MNILWAGGEDIDFPVIGSATISTAAGRFRSGWARCTIAMSSPAASPVHSAAFSGGALTSAWLSCQFWTNNTNTTSRYLGFGLSGTSKCLGFGVSSTAANKFCIFKYDGTTRTELAAESGTSIAPSTLLRVDMQVTSFGPSATVNLYVNGVSILTFTGDVTVSGMSNFDSVIVSDYSGSGSSVVNYSEVFVADSDTRAVQGLQTLALTGAGTTNNWSNNTFTNINGINFSDASPADVNTTGKDQQYTVTTPTPTTYSVLAVVQSARLARPAGSTPTQVKLGYGNGAGGSFGTGAAKTPSAGFSNFQQIDQINPVTGVAFTQSDLASLQLDMQSA